MTEGTPSTYGQKAVGLNFNPSNDPKVQQIKELYAQIIDICNQEVVADTDNLHGERNRMYKIAITEAQTSQMWAVKAITWQF